MLKFRPILAILALLAVLASPVLAMMTPCCCTRPEAATPKGVTLEAATQPCCESGSRQISTPAVGEHACCAKNRLADTASGESASTCTNAPTCTNVAPHGVHRATCCCVQSAPATVTVRETRTILDNQPVALHHVALPVNVGLSVGTRHAALDRVVRPSGPPLLALYCIWLN